MANKIKKGIDVVVIAGYDKSKTGKVVSVNNKKQTVTVEGINVCKKAVKPVGDKEGGIVEFTAPIHISNVMTKDKYDSRKKAGKA